MATGAKLPRIRGNSTQEVPVGEGAMAALIGADIELANQVDAAPMQVLFKLQMTMRQQVVISGSLAGVKAAMAAAQEAGLKRVVELPVSAPFHSSLMAPAAPGQGCCSISDRFFSASFTCLL